MKKRILALIFILCLASILATYFFFPRVERVSTEKFFYYNHENNTLTISGGSSDNPMTWSDIQRAIQVLNATSATILMNTTIVIE